MFQKQPAKDNIPLIKPNNDKKSNLVIDEVQDAFKTSDSLDNFQNDLAAK